MSGLQATMILLCITVPLLGWTLLIRQARRYLALFRAGAADPVRADAPVTRTLTMLREVLGHTRMARRPVVALAHWFVMVSFFVLSLTLVRAFFQLWWPDFALPGIGHWAPCEWLTELSAWGALAGILVLMGTRLRPRPRAEHDPAARDSRFYGSSRWQAYYVELTILGVAICVLSLRTLEYQLALKTGTGPETWVHFPLTAWMSGVWAGMPAWWITESIHVVAGVKILISSAWMIVIGLQPDMGIAWHRFLAFFNIWFQRDPSGRPALGAAQPITAGGQQLTAASPGEITGGDQVRLGAGRIEDFTWKGLLGFSSCTGCGRCQAHCPAWTTGKPLSPKLLVMTLRDHALAKYPYLTGDAAGREGLRPHERRLAGMPLVGDLGYHPGYPLTAYDPLGPDAVIDHDVLWSCTTCGACVEQCPVDIEHIDAILDLRRHQVLAEPAFPAEFGGLFTNLRDKGNPWGLPPATRMDWAADLPFPVPVAGQDITDLTEVDYLFWVGCAGALDERARATTRAVAELLHLAGVSFAVLGTAESCTGDAARRAGNEILFQQLAASNIATLDRARATSIVVTCAHCYNTLANEYPQAGGHYQVLHHTQLLNRLVRDKRLIPVAPPAGMPASRDAGADPDADTVTYHDPCYLGRHNRVYAPPRELLASLPGVELREMPRHGASSFCCGAGGARMWAGERPGTRISDNRAAEALATGAGRIAVGCPYCRAMLTGSLAASQAGTGAGPQAEVTDIAQMLLAAVRRGVRTGEGAGAQAQAPEAGRPPVPGDAAATGTGAAAEAQPAGGAADPGLETGCAPHPDRHGDPGLARPPASPAAALTAGPGTAPGQARLPAGRILASQALALFSSPQAPAHPPAPPADPAPAPAQALAEPARFPVHQPASTPAGTPGQARPAAAPVPPASARAWQRVAEAAAGQPITASDVLSLLSEE